MFYLELATQSILKEVPWRRIYMQPGSGYASVEISENDDAASSLSDQD